MGVYVLLSGGMCFFRRWLFCQFVLYLLAPFFCWGGGGVYISFNAVLNVRETTIEHNIAGTNHGHQIMAKKYDSFGGAPAVTVVNTRFIPCTACETTGTNFYLYDYDDSSSNSGAAAYGMLVYNIFILNPFL